MRILLLGLISLAGSACVAAPDTRPINQPMLRASAQPGSDLGVDGEAIALAFSGGGARAASFSLGVLLQLHDMKGADGAPLSERIAYITGVSGGAITAAYYGRYGAEGLGGFRATALDKDWQGELHTSWVSPENWQRLLQGGLNGPDKLADWLDREVFMGARMQDMRSQPMVVINATDLYSGAPFAFAPAWFEAICSDLAGVRLADAVAASMAVPIAFRPIVVKTYPEACPAGLAPWVSAALRDRRAPLLLRETARSLASLRDPAKMTHAHLADGGVADNFGVSSFVTLSRSGAGPYAPFSAQDGVKLSRLTFIIVNAERPAEGTWALKAAGPDGPELISTALGLAVNAPKRAAADAFRGFLEQWRKDLITWRCGLDRGEAERLGAGAGWTCEGVDIVLDIISFEDLGAARAARLGSAQTAVSLPSDLIDDLISGGRAATAWNETLLGLAR